MENNSLEAVKRLLSEGRITQDAAEEIFPELKESEDEKIKKEIINYFKCQSREEPSRKDIHNKWIAWLKKQGENNELKKIEPKFKVGDTIRPKGSYAEFKITGISISEGYYKGKGWSLDIIAADDDYELVEQNPADKVEPKFKVGDWIVRDSDGLTISIKSVKDGIYYFHQGGILFAKTVDECYHLWTIQDAKDGDVLAEHETIVLFKKIEGQNIRCYCTYHYLGYNPTLHVDTLQNKKPYRPATKEQRDKLEKAITDADYKWDAEKKELRKIEQNPAWSEDEKPLLEKFKQAVYDCAWEKVTCKAEGETKEEYANRWAEHFLLIVRDWADDYIEYTIQQKLRKSYDEGKKDAIKTNSPAWSEEDERMINSIIKNIDEGEWFDIYQADWLRFLKERYTWKPSKKQLEALEHSLGDYNIKIFEDRHEILTSLYQDLKKLKGK